MMKDDFYTAEELSRYLRIPRPTIYYLTQNKKIPAIKIGRHWRYRKMTIEEWMRRQEKIK